jgi:hypothetical protein
MHLITQPVQVLPRSSSAMKGNNGTNKILYHDIVAKPSRTFLVLHCSN